MKKLKFKDKSIKEKLKEFHGVERWEKALDESTFAESSSEFTDTLSDVMLLTQEQQKILIDISIEEYKTEYPLVFPPQETRPVRL